MDIYEEIVRLRQQGRKAALATIVHTQGSIPSFQSSKLLVRDDGSMVGTVGGGTSLPSAKACLDILGLAGCGKSTALAEVCAALVLAGELTIIGAFCSGDFALAHRALSRGEELQRSNDND